MKLVTRIFRRTDWYVTSVFGKRKNPITGKEETHNGTDYGTNGQKWPQYALENGTVLSAGKDSTGALFAWVRFPRIGMDILYYHLDKLFVSTGQAVTKDTIIGNTGTTGNSTGIHLHLAMRKIGSTAYLDPHAYVYVEESASPAPSIGKGSVVNFLGGHHYISAAALQPTGNILPAGTAEITAISSGARHPYHLVGKTAKGLHGWVDWETIKELSTPPAIQKGDVVQFLGGPHFASADAAVVSSNMRTAGRAKVTAISPGKAHPYHVVGEPGGGSNVYGWVDADKVKK